MHTYQEAAADADAVCIQYGGSVCVLVYITVYIYYNIYYIYAELTFLCVSVFMQSIVDAMRIQCGGSVAPDNNFILLLTHKFHNTCNT